MVLNNKAQMFSVWFPYGFFYKEVEKQWTPYVQRMKIPYQSVTDFMNAQIQTITYPSIDIGSSTQQQGQYPIEYTIGKELEPIINKDFTITFKLTESYLTYWILYTQVFWYLEYLKMSTIPIFMDTINLSFLDNSGLALTNFKYRYIIPKGLGEFQLSYAAQAATYNTISWNLHYNRMDIY